MRKDGATRDGVVLILQRRSLIPQEAQAHEGIYRKGLFAGFLAWLMLDPGATSARTDSPKDLGRAVGVSDFGAHEDSGRGPQEGLADLRHAVPASPGSR